MHERYEVLRVAITWMPPLMVLAWWMFKVSRERNKHGKSRLIHRWYTNIWFVILAICLWAVALDIIFVRFLEHGR